MEELIGKKITITIKKLGINGEGIGYYKRTIVFVPYALPTEEVLIEITSVAKNFITGRLLQLKKKSADRTIAPCKVYEECGGCQLQHLTYAKQLDFKRDLVKQALKKFQPKGFSHFQVLPTIGMTDPWHYRNKLQFQIRQNKQDQAIAGLYRPNSHQLVAIDDCLVQIPETMEIMNEIVQLLRHFYIPIYNEKKNSGIIRTVMIRIGMETRQEQVVFITNSSKFPKHHQLIEALTEKFPQIVSIMQNIQTKKTSLIMGDETKHLWGKQAVEERLDDLVFDLSARAFFQLNPVQTNKLYAEARKAFDPKPTDQMIDAYCGVGIIGLSLAPMVQSVYGMDVVPEAIEDAKKNAQKSNIQNAYYEVGKAEELIPKWLKEGKQVDGLIIDPPRTGLDDRLLQVLIKHPISKIVYVSCNPSTLARDLAILVKQYHVDYLQPLDMFPQTAKCEVVVSLRRKKNFR